MVKWYSKRVEGSPLKNAVIYPAISAIISGFVLALLGYYLFTTHPNNPIEHLRVERSHSEISSEVLRKLINDVSKKFGSGPAEPLLLDPAIAFGEQVSLEIYDIHNEGDESLAGISLTLDEFIFGYIQDSDGLKYLDNQTRRSSINLLPSDRAKILLIKPFYSYMPEEKFLISGRSVPIADVENDFSFSLILEKLNDAGFSVFMAVFIIGITGVGTLFIALTAAILSLFGVMKKPATLAYFSDNETVARNLALVTFFKNEDPEKFQLIIAKAEKIYAKWEAEKGAPPN